MQNTKNTTTTNHTLTLSREMGRLWILKDIKPFRKNFERFFEENLGHDIGKLVTCGCPNYVLDILADEDKKMDIDFRMAQERVELPGFVEFELVETGNQAAKYHVNDCPGKPQLEAWVSDSFKQIFKEYPRFAYIKKM